MDNACATQPAFRNIRENSAAASSVAWCRWRLVALLSPCESNAGSIKLNKVLSVRKTVDLVNGLAQYQTAKKVVHEVASKPAATKLLTRLSKVF